MRIPRKRRLTSGASARSPGVVDLLLECHIATTADDLGADFEELLPQRGQRPVLDLLRQYRLPLMAISGPPEARNRCPLTEEIDQQIAGMQSVAGEAVEAIGSIGATITEVNEIATAIAAAVEEQGAATQDIARNVQEAARGTQQVTSNITGVSEGAGETGKSAASVLEAAGQLSQQSNELRGAVDKFLTDIKAA